jgi:TolB-like protein/DNA-binding CsgD family transcriptional regulator/Flp pilus assembly protein TadD
MIEQDRAYQVTGPTGATPDNTLHPDGDRPAAASVGTVAVLPFINLSDDPGQSHLSDGVAEDVSVVLASQRDLQVIGWGSSVVCRPFAGDVARVAAELNVRHVVDGSVRRVGDRLQVVARLHDTTQAQPVWTERFDTWVAEASALTVLIGERVAVRVAPDGPSADLSSRIGYVPDPECYELTLRARAALLRGGGTDDTELVSLGIALAQEAGNRDPRWGEAQRCIAWGLCVRAELGRFGPQATADYEAARQVALRLRDLESGGATAHALLGHIAMRQLRHDEALSSLRLAHELEPNAVTAMRWLSWEEANNELTDEALRHGRLSLRLSPCDKLVTQGHWTLALAEYVAGRIESCVKHARQALAMRPRLAVHYVVLAACLAELGELSEAHYTLRAAQSLCPGLVESRLAGISYFVRPGLTERYIRSLRLAAASDSSAAHGVRSRPSAAPDSAADPSARALATLTAREREVLSLVASGQSNTEIAARLGISDHTAKRHIANVLARLDLPTRGAAATLAARYGLI